MAVSLPAPATNRTRAGNIGAASGVVGADLVVALGDFTGGAAEDMFTATAHGLTGGQYLYLLEKAALGVVNGAIGTQFRVKVVNANVFQLTNTAGTIIEHSADGTAVFLKGGHDSTAAAQLVVLPRLIVADGDFTGGTTEDEFIPRASHGLHGLEEADTLKLLHKEAAGVVVGIGVNTTVFAKSVRTDGFELSATSGGADIENTADGLAIFLKTS